MGFYAFFNPTKLTKVEEALNDEIQKSVTTNGFTPAELKSAIVGWKNSRKTSLGSENYLINLINNKLNLGIPLEDFDELEAKVDLLATVTPYTMGITPINLIYPELFNWLNMLDVNVLIILILMAAVAIINMVTALLILIVERSNMIGMLKALGMKNRSIMKIFLNLAAFIVFRGLLLGNALAFGIGFLQQQFHLVKLSEKDYYVSSVPVNFQPFDFVLVNGACFAICLILLLLPANVVSKISPVKSIRFD
jgi:lipoprotein-releasing system permease protein